jgi:serine/threonine protein kinase
MRDLRDRDKRAKYQIFGRPQKIELTAEHKMGRDAELVKSIEVPKEWLTEDIYLADFGLASKPENMTPGYPGLPKTFCAPELFHGGTANFASDMWSYMCLFVEFYFETWLFHDDIVCTYIGSVVNCLGPFPAEWEEKYDGPETKRDWWYNSSYQGDPKYSLEQLIERSRKEATEREKQLALSVLSRGFSLRPEQRLTATQFLADPDFNALLQLFGC